MNKLQTIREAVKTSGIDFMSINAHPEDRRFVVIRAWDAEEAIELGKALTTAGFEVSVYDRKLVA